AAVVAHAIVVALAVGSTAQTGLGEHLVVEPPFSLERELALVGVEFLLPVLTRPAREQLSPSLAFQICVPCTQVVNANAGGATARRSQSRRGSDAEGGVCGWLPIAGHAAAVVLRERVDWAVPWRSTSDKTSKLY